VAGAPDGVANAYVRDLELGETRFVGVNRFDDFASASAAGISDDGRYALLNGGADMVDFPPVAAGLFRRDLWYGTNELVSFNAANTAGGDSGADGKGVSGDGRYVLFTSYGTDFYPLPGQFFVQDVYLRDMQTLSNHLVSITPDRTARGNGHAFNPQLSRDGRHVFFLSNADNLATNALSIANSQLYRRDMATESTEMISTNTAGTKSGNGWVDWFAISPDGRFAVFVSAADDLTSLSDMNGDHDAFLSDRLTGETICLSTNLTGEPDGLGNAPIFNTFGPDRPGVSVSGDGRYAAFQSARTNFVTLPDDNETLDVFLRDNLTGEIRLISRNAAGTAAGSGESSNPRITEDGRRVFFQSMATNIVTLPDVSGVAVDLFVHDIASGGNTLITHNYQRTATAQQCLGEGNEGLLMEYRANTNGTLILFHSPGEDLFRLPDTNCDQDTFHRRLSP
jgi:Tol biopolymer transport system component